ncbi:GrpB family protein [Aminobacter anthyllidis]|uniref:GrpB family protein n=1 Tax=Aminobacter anthyllidis TaxID=1035067 RepID=UPI003B75CC63
MAFRDYLRANRDAAKTYGLLKKRLADRFGSDRDGYSNAKTAFIAKALSMRSRNS